MEEKYNELEQWAIEAFLQLNHAIKEAPLEMVDEWAGIRITMETCPVDEAKLFPQKESSGV